MCLITFPLWAQATDDNNDYVDLGLPSGTLWKSKNEKGGFKTYDEAIAQFGDNLPTREQCEELIGMCDWIWTNRGYKVIGPNGKNIFIPAAGCRLCEDDGHKMGGIGIDGYYWTAEPDKDRPDCAWVLRIFSSREDVSQDVSCGYRRCGGNSVRLVQD